MFPDALMLSVPIVPGKSSRIYLVSTQNLYLYIFGSRVILVRPYFISRAQHVSFVFLGWFMRSIHLPPFPLTSFSPPLSFFLSLSLFIYIYISLYFSIHSFRFTFLSIHLSYLYQSTILVFYLLVRI